MDLGIPFPELPARHLRPMRSSGPASRLSCDLKSNFGVDFDEENDFRTRQHLLCQCHEVEVQLFN